MKRFQDYILSESPFNAWKNRMTKKGATKFSPERDDKGFKKEVVDALNDKELIGSFSQATGKEIGLHEGIVAKTPKFEISKGNLHFFIQDNKTMEVLNIRQDDLEDLIKVLQTL